MIDTLHTVETPEGVELDLPVAGPVARTLAWMVDASVQAVLYIGLLWVVSLLSLVDKGAVGLAYLGVFAINWFYGVSFEVLNHGRTPGKLALGLQVVREDGTPVTLGASVLRNFLRAVDWLPICYALGLCSALIDPSFRRLGDLAAGTLVVYRPREAGASSLPEVEPAPPRIPLEPDERRALIAFAERAPLLSPARADELAAIPSPLLAPGEKDPRGQLVRVAAWLIGIRPGDPR